MRQIYTARHKVTEAFAVSGKVSPRVHPECKARVSLLKSLVALVETKRFVIDTDDATTATLVSTCAMVPGPKRRLLVTDPQRQGDPQSH